MKHYTYVTRSEIVMGHLDDRSMVEVKNYINQNGATVLQIHDDEIVDREGNKVCDATTFLVENPGFSVSKTLKRGMNLEKSPNEKHVYYVR